MMICVHHIDIDECTRNPCEHGRCVNKDGGYKCTCSPGWTGQNCRQGRPCKSGWRKYNDHCYKLMKGKVIWSVANSQCKRHGANLASITSHGENDFVTKLIFNAPVGDQPVVWFGLNWGDGQWEWTDRSRLVYTNWAPHEPNSKALLSLWPACAAISSTTGHQWMPFGAFRNRGEWTDQRCAGYYPYICKGRNYG
ncbi:snaclec coagulation factor IX/factor X-binding protein subunit B-like [Branchiostoma lanceolatum]|uniref:snaclec coagulation factor IX/factor X-binding protein subunit B-like n=1 Tax=Branchiostoma lanceolatum TaxID=7740 RepID=UPI0034547649